MRAGACVLLASLALAAPADAKVPITVIRTVTYPHHHARRTATTPAVPSCPAGVPVQPITVVNQANVRPWALARVERALVDQSLQLRAAWVTPCVQFAPGGWPLYLKIGQEEPHGAHFYYGQPYVIVWTGGSTWEGWSRVFSHEVVETLADPTTARTVYNDGVGRNIEVSAPVLEPVYVTVAPARRATGSRAKSPMGPEARARTIHEVPPRQTS